MTNDARDTSMADFLSDLSVAVVVALQTGDEESNQQLSANLAEFAQDARASSEPELAAYFEVLHGLLQGEEVTAAAEELVGPYRAGYQRIVQELEAGPAEEPLDMPLPEWLARVSSLVATTVKRGSDEDRAALAQELAGLASKVPANETEFHDFMTALQRILQGEDTRELALRLKPPYREAYQSLLQLLAADDTTDFAVHAILDRIQHNSVMALTRDNPELRVSVAEALADVEEKLPEDEPTSAHFRALIAGAIALLIDREPPQAVKSLSGPFAETWQRILEASQDQ